MKYLWPLLETNLVKCLCRQLSTNYRSTYVKKDIKDENVIRARIKPNPRSKDKKFVDWKRTILKAGNGGKGSVSFVHSRDHKGGPNGGDGGKGGSIKFVTDQNYSHLSHLNHFYVAKNGGAGSAKNRHGKNAEDIILKVPVGTTITNAENRETIADLTIEGEVFTSVKGGCKGLGNVHFKSPHNVRPQECTEGEEGEELQVEIELKLIADIALVGFPNAGKSSLLRCISRAEPKVGNYPFTTLKPNIGVMHLCDEISVTVADVPGLLKGAHENIGLGHSFLRHIERCHTIIYVLDISMPNILQQFQVLKDELDFYKTGLSHRPSLFVANKSDLMENCDKLLNHLQMNIDVPVIALSAKYHQNIALLKTVLSDILR